MAERIEQFSRVAAGPQKYPWADWMDGSIWRVTRGEDFPGKTLVFRNNLHAKAQMKGYTVDTSILGDTIEFRFTPRADA